MRHRKIVLATAAAALLATTAITTTQLVSGQSTADETVFIPITPCRLLDTRSNPDINTGPRNTPIGDNQTVLFNAHDGKDAGSPCTIPSSATAVATNTVAVNATAASYLTLYPGDVPNPGTANLNFVAGQPPAPNAAVIPLAGDGSFNVFNAFGTVDVVIDINGYYQPSTNVGATGPQGPPGPPGGTDTAHHANTVDTSINVDANDTSVAIASNGAPLISFWDFGNDALRIAACDNPTCTSAHPRIMDNTANVGRHSSIAIGADGLPVISYYDSTNTSLKVAACTHPTCRSTPTLRTVDNGAAVGRETSLAIGADGNPIISYYDETNTALKVAACGDAVCDTATITTVDDTAAVGRYSSIAIGADGNPVVSYQDETNETLKVAACSNPACTSASLRTLDSLPFGGITTSIAVRPDGTPIVSYIAITNSDLKVAACADATCSAPPVISTHDTATDVGGTTSITIGHNGRAIIAYSTIVNSRLKVAACQNNDCTSVSIATIDADVFVGTDASIVIGLDSRPVIAHSRIGSDDLKVAVCGNATCASYAGQNR